MNTHDLSHSKGLPLTALIVGAVALLATIVYAIIPVGTPATVVSGLLGAVAVVLGIIARTRHSADGIAMAAVVVGAVAILLAVGIIAGVFAGMSMGGGGTGGGGGYTY